MPDDIFHETLDSFSPSNGRSPASVRETAEVTTSSGSAGAEGSSSSSTAETAKDEAKNVATQAADSGGQVLDTAKAETSEVLSHAGQSARTLFDQVRSELTDQAGTQQHRVAGGLHDLAEELERMGQSSDQSGLAASLVKQASDRTRSTADWMSHREPGDLVTEVKRFAARKPGTFLAAAAALGFLGARLTRGLAASNGATSTSAPGLPATPVDTRSQPAATPVSSLGSAGGSAYTTDEALPTVPTVTIVSHGQPVTYPSGDAAAHPRLTTAGSAPSDMGDGTGGAHEDRS